MQSRTVETKEDVRFNSRRGNLADRFDRFVRRRTGT